MTFDYDLIIFNRAKWAPYSLNESSYLKKIKVEQEKNAFKTLSGLFAPTNNELKLICKKSIAKI